jgi:hypothetical protein
MKDESHIVPMRHGQRDRDRRWSLPKPYPDCLTLECNIVRVNWENGETTLTLPVDAPKNPALLFAGP